MCCSTASATRVIVAGFSPLKLTSVFNRRFLYFQNYGNPKSHRKRLIQISIHDLYTTRFLLFIAPLAGKNGMNEQKHCMAIDDRILVASHAARSTLILVENASISCRFDETPSGFALSSHRTLAHNAEYDLSVIRLSIRNSTVDFDPSRPPPT